MFSIQVRINKSLKFLRNLSIYATMSECFIQKSNKNFYFEFRPTPTIKTNQWYLTDNLNTIEHHD